MHVSDKFSLVGTLSTFERPSCTACCSHKTHTCVNMSSFPISLPSRHASCRAAVATHVSPALHASSGIPCAARLVSTKPTARSFNHGCVDLRARRVVNGIHVLATRSTVSVTHLVASVVDNLLRWSRHEMAPRASKWPSLVCGRQSSEKLRFASQEHWKAQSRADVLLEWVHG